MKTSVGFVNKFLVVKKIQIQHYEKNDKNISRFSEFITTIP